jgi:Fe-S cluster assembly protein SufD
MIEPREQIDKTAMLKLALNQGNFISESAHKKALESLASLDFPNRKTEDWKYTRTTKIANTSWLPQSIFSKDISSYQIADLDANVLVFINGEFVEELSTITAQDGVAIQPINKAENIEQLGFDSLASKEDIFTPLNTAFALTGAFIHVSKKVKANKPIHIINVTQGAHTAAQTRHFIVVEPLAEAHIVESFYSDETLTLSNSVSEFIVKEGASLSYDKIQYSSLSNHHVCTEYVHQENNSNFTINTITLNGGWVRNGLNIVVDGQNCTTKLNGLYLLKDNQHVDNHTKVDHKQPHCNSYELYKGVADDNSTAVFNGKVFVREDAQKIQAFQQNNNIVMSANASINAKPELEIYADDVKCSHGSTTGQFDEEAVFYLRARGVSEDSARKLLIAAFANDVIEHIQLDAVKTKVYELLKQRFGWSF